MPNVTMEQTDAIFGGLAECYVTINGNRLNFMQLTEFESTFKPKIVDVKILGRVQKGKKMAGGEGSWKGKAHYNTSTLRKVMLEYKKSGLFVPFEIQVTNEDPSTSIGRQTITHSGCLLDELILAKFVAGDEILEEDISGTFDDWDMPEEFTELVGMS